MLDKIKKSINKLIGGSVSDAPPQPAPQVPVAPPQPAPQVPVAPPQLAPQVPVVPLVPTKVGKPVVPGEIYYKDCNEAYGPISLQSVSYNLLNSGAAQNVTGGVDCTDLDYAPIKTALGGPQIPHMGNIPGLGQLKAPDLGAVQGTIRPDSLQKVQPDADKKANVTMIWADWCGYSNKAKPEWNKLVSDMNDNSINGCKLNMRDLEHKRDEQEIKEKYSDVDGFPTYVVEVTDSSGKLIDKQNFNSIERNDMQQKLEAILNGI
jgi:thiol-disulfide isomerase/thioredoxin